MNTSKAITAIVSVVVIVFASTKLIPKNSTPAGTGADTVATSTVIRTIPPILSSEDEGEGESEDGVPAAKPSSTPVAPVATKETLPSPGSTSQASVYKDGSYSAQGSYYSPEGIEYITINVTLKGGIITDTSAVNQANDGRSVRYQDMFIGGYKQYVVGKSIATIKLDKVSGSSLTGTGFNDAISKIKAQAQA